MRRASAILGLFVALVTALPLRSAADAPAVVDAPPPAVDSFAEPAIAPDRSEIAFVSGGDVWSVGRNGGVAHLLVAAGGGASRPMFSPDGKRLAFVSTRPGATGIATVTLEGGALTRLTHDDVTPELDGWSADGRFVYFTTSAHNIAYDGDIMRVAAGGGTPMRVVGERFVNAMNAAPSPDGSAVAFVRNGFVQWWRRGHSHMDQAEIVIAHPATGRFDQVTTGDAKDRWPMWSPDGATLYFVSDRSGSDELWSRGATGELRRLTALHGEPVLWPTISRDGRTIAFEHALEIWTYDIASGTAQRVPIDLRGGAERTGRTHVTARAGFTALALAPDGKKLAFVARGRVFAAPTDGGPTQLVTAEPAAAYDLPVWSKDSRRVAYVVDRGTEQRLAIAELPDGAPRLVTPPGRHDDYPHWSPDGKLLAFVRDGRELHLLDVAAGSDRVVARGVLDRRPFGDMGDIAFSPAGDWIAYLDQAGGFTNANVVPTTGGASRAVSFLPNGNAGSVVWSPDATRLFLVTSQRTEPGQIAQIDLVPRAPQFREDAFRRLFDTGPTRTELPSRNTVPAPAPTGAPSPRPQRSTPPAAKTTIDFAGIRDRVALLPTGLDVNRIAAAPDGKTLVLVADAAGQENLYAFGIDETADDPPVARQLTSSSGPKSDLAVTSDSRAVTFLDGGAIWSVGLDGSKLKRIDVSAEFDVDFDVEKNLVFAQAWSLLDRWYADPRFHGADWNAVERTYAPHAAGARTPAELRRVISLMLGELNSSHLGIRGPRAPGVPPERTGRLGVQWDADTYARSGRLRIAELAPLGPLALVGIGVGDVVLAVEGTSVGPQSDIDELLTDRIGKRTTLRIAPHGDSASARTVAVLPIDTPGEQQLWYRSWVEARRRYVETISRGRLGYVHLLDMGEESLRRFYLDLDVQNRARAGVVVDIRNNEGGFVDPYAVDVLTRREYARFASRFGTDAPERTSLGQRTLDNPTVLVTNEHSLSDAENFTEAYRVLHGGPVVGEPTAGWIIFTSSADLADGSGLRLPSTLVFAHDGIDMELHPRPVDLRVDNPPGATANGADPQLAAAVRRLLSLTRSTNARD